MNVYPHINIGSERLLISKGLILGVQCLPYEKRL